MGLWSTDATTKPHATTRRLPRSTTVHACTTTPWVCVAAIALRTLTATGCATTRTIAWVRTTHVACATVLVRFWSAVVRRLKTESATARATSLTRWACAAAPARRTPTAMGCATTRTTALGRLTLVACATVLERFTSAVARTLPRDPAIAKATRLTPWAYAVGAAQPIRTATASATTRRCWAARTARHATTPRRPTWKTVHASTARVLKTPLRCTRWWWSPRRVCSRMRWCTDSTSRRSTRRTS